MSEQQEQDQATADKVQSIVQRYNTVATFKDQVNNDPIATLQAEGLTKEVISSTLSRMGIEADVSGYVWIPSQEFDEGSTGSFHPKPPFAHPY